MIQIILPNLHFRPRRAGPGPNSLFGEVTTLVNYTAIDRAGNLKTCFVKVVVKGEFCDYFKTSKN